MPKQWEVVKSKYVLDNPWIKVRQDDTYIAGEIFDIYIIEENHDVIVVAINDNGEAILKKEYRPGVKKKVFELPAGYIEKGETPRKAALSELHDETGYKAGTIKKVGELYRSPKRLTQVTNVFLATDLKWKGQNLEADEQGIEVSFVSLKKVYKMIQKGEIKDMATVASVMMVRDKLGTK